MMDYYSQFPAPNVDAAKREIKARCQVQNYDWAWKQQTYVDDLISEAFIHSGILDDNNNIKFSFSGWHSFGQNDVIKSIEIILEQRRKTKLRRKIRGFLRSSYLLIKLHNASIEKLYNPNSQYVNSVLKNEFEKNAI